MAVSVAEAVPADAYPPVIIAQIRAHAWKDLGKALRFLGRYDESLEALSRAETEGAQYPTLANDLAIVRFNLAMTFQEVNRYDESLTLLTECRDVFRQHAETNLMVLCSLGEGVLLQRLGKYREAREIYLLLVASRSDIEKESLAALHHAIGFCSVDLGDYAEAEANLLRSISLHRELGQTLQMLKSEMGRGRLFLRRGDFALAVSHLRPVRREFIRKSLAEEAGLCGLEIVEALLMLGRAAEAENLARKIMHEFVTAALSTRAVAALGYLSEAIASKRASAKTASDVREYVISLRTTPERDFHSA